MSGLPVRLSDQAYCEVSALEAGFVRVPLGFLIDTAKEGEMSDLPVLAFLLTHSKSRDRFLFDLGIRKDIHNLPPKSRQSLDKLSFIVSVPDDIVDSLAKGGLAPTDVKYVCPSHIHFDHIGDPSLFPTAEFLVGADAQPLIAHGYPEDPASSYAQDLLPADRTQYLNPAGWTPLGPFPHALDFYGDGSLYIVDAPGHMPGHLNVLARTSADGGAHDRRLLTGEAGIPVHPVYGCPHGHKEQTEETISRIRELERMDSRVRVLIAHDVPWYQANKDSSAFWPRKIESL
ncbi:Metallo-hydrolase/oxidoreductase [Trametes polyzona]|nr:Metallo-hydrolase/oxidoreductase [Trametes polyzona]